MTDGELDIRLQSKHQYSSRCGCPYEDCQQY